MKTLSALLFFTLILEVFPAVFLEQTPFVKKHPDECYDAKTGKFLKVGETMEWDHCGRKICLKHAKNLFIEYQTCPTMSFPKHCKKEVDLSQPYPECCGRIICPDNFSDENQMKNTPSEEVSGFSRFEKY